MPAAAAYLLAGLAFLGRHGTRAFALSLVLGFMLPGLATTMKPLLGPIIFAFVAINIMRADVPTLRRVGRDPVYVAVAVFTNTLIPFVLVGAVIAVIGRDLIDPGLLLGLSLAVAAPPLVAAPAYALLLGFSNALPLTVLVLGMLISPLIAPLLADTLAGAAVPLDRGALMLRLAIFLGGAGLLGIAARIAIGIERLAARKAELDGLGVVLFFIFAIGLTEGVNAGIRSMPWLVLGYTAIAFAVFMASFVATLSLWWRFGAEDAMTLALATGLRNMGLLVAVLGVGNLPEKTFIFFGLMQVPIYFAPQLLLPLARIIRARAAPHRAD